MFSKYDVYTTVQSIYCYPDSDVLKNKLNMYQSSIKAESVYLSLGDQESKTRNAVMATVRDRICEAHNLLSRQGVRCELEWNQGNHFKEPYIRTAKAFAWIIQHVS